MNGHYSSFAHVVCPFHARLTGMDIAPVLLVPAVALVFLCGGFLGDHCSGITLGCMRRPAMLCMLVGSLPCSLLCSWLGSFACCVTRYAMHCSAHCYACLLNQLIIDSMHCSAHCCTAHCCTRLLVALLICLLCFLSTCRLARAHLVCYSVHCSTHALPVCLLCCSFTFALLVVPVLSLVRFMGLGTLLLLLLLISLNYPDAMPPSA